MIITINQISYKHIARELSHIGSFILLDKGFRNQYISIERSIEFLLNNYDINKDTKVDYNDLINKFINYIPEL